MICVLIFTFVISIVQSQDNTTSATNITANLAQIAPVYPDPIYDSYYNSYYSKSNSPSYYYYSNSKRGYSSSRKSKNYDSSNYNRNRYYYKKNQQKKYYANNRYQTTSNRNSNGYNSNTGYTGYYGGFKQYSSMTQYGRNRNGYGNKKYRRPTNTKNSAKYHRQPTATVDKKSMQKNQTITTQNNLPTANILSNQMQTVGFRNGVFHSSIYQTNNKTSKIIYPTP